MNRRQVIGGAAALAVGTAAGIINQLIPDAPSRVAGTRFLHLVPSIEYSEDGTEARVSLSNGRGLVFSFTTNLKSIADSVEDSIRHGRTMMLEVMEDRP